MLILKFKTMVSYLNQLLTLTPYEQDNYNTVVAIAMNNLNLLGLKNKHGVLRDHPDCYLNPHNRVQAEQVSEGVKLPPPSNVCMFRLLSSSLC